MILAVCGPPGSGKTTIATRVHDRLRDDVTSRGCDDVASRDRDALASDDRDVRLLHSDDYAHYPYDRMYDAVTASDDHFVLDGTFYRRAHQQPFLALPDCHFALVRADLDTCLRRDYERDGIGEKAVRVIHSEFHEPPVDLVLDTDILPVEDAVRLLTDRAREWLRTD